MIHGTLYAFRHPSIIVKCPNGLCYEVYVTDPFIRSVKVGDEINLFTYIKHDPRSLDETMFGLSTAEERDIFHDLLSVKKVGPVAAIRILGFPAETIRQKIAVADYHFFSMVKGIGINTAKAVCFELQKKYFGENKE